MRREDFIAPLEKQMPFNKSKMGIIKLALLDKIKR